MNTISKLFWISRPLSWPNTVYPFAVGFLLTFGGVPSGIDLLTYIAATLYFIGPYNLLMYGVNDIYDYESDIKNPRKGGVEGMKEARTFHPTIAWAVLWTNLPFLLLLLFFGSWPARIVLLLVVGAAVAYSIKGLRFKEVPFLDSLTSSFHFVGPLLYAVVLAGFTPNAWPWLLAFFLWGIASHAFGAVQDIIPDREAKIQSIATVLGATNTVRLSVLLYLAASYTVALQGSTYWPIAAVGLLYLFNCMPFLHLTDANSGYANSGWKRFLWLNYISGAVVTIVILHNARLL